MLTDLVVRHAAAVLGYESADAVEAQRAFKDLGFDSPGAVELRNRLVSAVGVKLPSTMIFDYPNAAALAEFVREQLVGSEDGATDEEPLLADLDRLEASLGGASVDGELQREITTHWCFAWPVQPF